MRLGTNTQQEVPQLGRDADTHRHMHAPEESMLVQIRQTQDKQQRHGLRFQDIPREVRFTETESRTARARSWGEEGMESYCFTV